jgi:hypothetical protein
MDRDSDTLLLTFGGLPSFGQGPGFNFEAIGPGVPVKRLLAYDPHGCWYHRGMTRGRSITFASWRSHSQSRSRSIT